MQRDEAIYDMFRRRVESGLTYGKGVYSGGVRSGGKYYTGDALHYSPVYEAYQHSEPARYPMGGKVEVDCRYKVNKDNKKCKKKKKMKAQKGKMPAKAKKGLKEYKEFYNMAKAEHPDWTRNDIICAWNMHRGKKPKKKKVREYCSINFGL